MIQASPIGREVFANKNRKTTRIPDRSLPADHSHKLEDFDTRISTLRDRLYRTALILTKSRQAAKVLLYDTCRKARRLYRRSNPGHCFGYWISHILLRNYTKTIAKKNKI